jgi:hypothetical protein
MSLHAPKIPHDQSVIEPRLGVDDKPHEKWHNPVLPL